MVLWRLPLRIDPNDLAAFLADEPALVPYLQCDGVFPRLIVAEGHYDVVLRKPFAVKTVFHAEIPSETRYRIPIRIRGGCRELHLLPDLGLCRFEPDRTGGWIVVHHLYGVALLRNLPVIIPDLDGQRVGSLARIAVLEGLARAPIASSSFAGIEIVALHRAVHVAGARRIYRNSLLEGYGILAAGIQGGLERQDGCAVGDVDLDRSRGAAPLVVGEDQLHNEYAVVLVPVHAHLTGPTLSVPEVPLVPFDAALRVQVPGSGCVEGDVGVGRDRLPACGEVDDRKLVGHAQFEGLHRDPSVVIRYGQTHGVRISRSVGIGRLLFVGIGIVIPELPVDRGHGSVHVGAFRGVECDLVAGPYVRPHILSGISHRVDDLWQAVLDLYLKEGGIGDRIGVSYGERDVVDAVIGIVMGHGRGRPAGAVAEIPFEIRQGPFIIRRGPGVEVNVLVCPNAGPVGSEGRFRSRIDIVRAELHNIVLLVRFPYQVVAIHDHGDGMIALYGIGPYGAERSIETGPVVHSVYGAGTDGYLVACPVIHVETDVHVHADERVHKIVHLGAYPDGFTGHYLCFREGNARFIQGEIPRPEPHRLRHDGALGGLHQEAVGTLVVNGRFHRGCHDGIVVRLRKAHVGQELPVDVLGGEYLPRDIRVEAYLGTLEIAQDGDLAAWMGHPEPPGADAHHIC